jgi:hypothetical protein
VDELDYKVVCRDTEATHHIIMSSPVYGVENDFPLFVFIHQLLMELGLAGGIKQDFA